MTTVAIVTSKNLDVYDITVDGEKLATALSLEQAKSLFAAAVEKERKLLAWKAGEIISSVEVK